MSEIKLKIPISIGQQWSHKAENALCEITDIWINCGGLAVIESVDENNELSIDSVSSFVNEYRFKG